MQYVSCRDGSPTLAGRRKYTFEQAIFSGWAEDGGMIMPACVPLLSASQLKALSTASYPVLCYEVMRLFISDSEVCDSALRAIILEQAFVRFGTEEVVAMRKNVAHSNVHVCELWHGPTLAFKDLGMQVLACLIQFFLARNGDVLNLLVGTSGDTGSSAIEAVRGLPNVSITVLYPKNRGISKLQELQMTTVGEIEPRVTVFGVDGSSDDLDVPIEKVFGDVSFRTANRVGSMNSVNICRILVQVVHFFWAYFQVRSKDDSCPVMFSVPTGACGHITAGAIARAMGLPIQLHAATNQNDIVHRLVSSGTTRQSECSAEGSRVDDAAAATPRIAVTNTLSPSMDILMPYNVERLLFLAHGGAVAPSCAAEAAEAMKRFKSTGQLTLSSTMHQNLRFVLGLTTSRTTDAECATTIRRVYSSTSSTSGGFGYVIDPHTAVGVHAAIKVLAPSRPRQPVVCIACAHPAKFAETIRSSLNVKGWEWLSPDDRAHPHVKNLLRLEGAPAVSLDLKRGDDWESLLRHHLQRVMETMSRTSLDKHNLATTAKGHLRSKL